MKKLALALVCLIGVAFFTSCDPTITNADPTISILDEDGCIQNNAVINLDEVYPFGFKVASNAETGVELSKLLIVVNDLPWDSVELTGKTEDIYRNQIRFSLHDRDSIVGTGSIKATLTDANGKTATSSIEFSINDPAKPLIPAAFTWFRQGNTITGLEEFGLEWNKNLKATHAQIKPLKDVTLFKFDAEKWDATTTDIEKARLFSAALENNESIQLYEGICTDDAGDKDYNEVIGTITTDGVYHLIHITHYHRGAFENIGYPFTITGEAK